MLFDELELPLLGCRPFQQRANASQAVGTVRKGDSTGVFQGFCVIGPRQGLQADQHANSLDAPSLRHGLGHVMRAIYEGTAMGTRHILEDLRRTGFEADGMYAAGGGTRSELWLQIHADACQVPIYLTGEPEATALGTAVCAAYGAGLFDSLEEASDRMVRVTREIEPNDLWADTYDGLFDRYVATYARLRDLMHAAAEDHNEPKWTGGR